MSNFPDILERARVVAIVRGSFASDRYLRISGALAEGGVHVQEFTMDRPHALEAIREARRHADEGVLLGAGTVRSGDAARRAVDAGAQFLVSPGLVGSVADAAREASVPYLPDVLTPSEVEAALSMGLDTVKLFPAQPLGPAYLAGLIPPLRGTRFVPTGGIGLDDVRSFLDAGATAVGLGGSLVSGDGEPSEIRTRCRTLALAIGDA